MESEKSFIDRKNEAAPAEHKKARDIFENAADYVRNNTTISVNAGQVPDEIKKLKGTGWIFGFENRLTFIDHNGNIADVLDIDYERIKSIDESSGAWNCAKKFGTELLGEKNGFVDIKYGGDNYYTLIAELRTRLKKQEERGRREKEFNF